MGGFLEMFVCLLIGVAIGLWARPIYDRWRRRLWR